MSKSILLSVSAPSSSWSMWVHPVRKIWPAYCYKGLKDELDQHQRCLAHSMYIFPLELKGSMLSFQIKKLTFFPLQTEGKSQMYLSWLCISNIDFSSVQSLSRVRLCDPMNRSTQASLSISNSRSPPKPMSIESVMPSSHLILCRPLLLLPSVFPILTHRSH